MRAIALACVAPVSAAPLSAAPLSDSGSDTRTDCSSEAPLAPAAAEVTSRGKRTARKAARMAGVAEASSPDSASVSSRSAHSDSEWQTLNDGLLEAMRERLDAQSKRLEAHVASCEERNAARAAEMRSVKGLVEKQMRSVRESREAMHEHTGVITQTVCNYANVVMEARFEQMQSSILSALAKQSAAGVAGAAPDASARFPDSQQAGAVLAGDGQRNMHVQVYSTGAGHIRIRLSDAIRISECQQTSTATDVPAAIASL
mmetsp:Transcript_25931/g.60748  ORF Transcript_25931/g.60748 Transcript_25931/m.60748 type:complete len:259 (+) Transcript_25931:331-1107(+)